MLPPLELGDVESHDVGIGERAAALQRREEPTVHLVERRLEGLAVGPPRVPQRFPREPVVLRHLPRLVEGCGIGSGAQAFVGAGYLVQGGGGFHLHPTIPEWGYWTR